MRYPYAFWVLPAVSDSAHASRPAPPSFDTGCAPVIHDRGACGLGPLGRGPGRRPGGRGGRLGREVGEGEVGARGGDRRGRREEGPARRRGRPPARRRRVREGRASRSRRQGQGRQDVRRRARRRAAPRGCGDLGALLGKRLKGHART